MKLKKVIVTLSLTLAISMLVGCGQGAKTTEVTGQATEKQDLTSKIVTTYQATDMSKNPQQVTDRKDSLIIGTEAPDGVFNPLFTPGLYDQNICDTMFAHLNTNDDKAIMQEWLADLPKISEDKLTYTYKIKDKAVWSDGAPITSKDIALSIKIICDKSYDGNLDFISGDTTIKGAKEYQSGTAKDISGLKIVDDKTIDITLQEPSSSAKYTLGDIIPLPESYYGKYYSQGNTDKLKDTFTAPGPASAAYKFVSYKPGQEVVLIENDKSFLGAPKIKNLVFKVTTTDTRLSMLQSGDIDFDCIAANPDNVETTESLGYLGYKMFPENGYGYLNINFNKPVLKDKAVRKALMMGLDRQKVTSAVYDKYAEVINVPQTKASWAYTEAKNKYEYNIEGAKKILDDAGWKVGSDGIREKDGIRLAIHYTAATGSKTGATILATAPETCKELGIDFSSDTIDFASLLSRMKGDDWELCSLGWSLSANPNDAPIFKSDGAQNNGHYSNAKVDELYNKIKGEDDTNKAKDLYAQLYSEINDDLPYILLNQSQDFYVYNGRVKNLDFSPYVRYSQNLYKATLE